MRRALVLTNEAARHPFRARLAPAAGRRRSWRRRTARTRALEDARDFLLAFGAFFLAASVFFA